MTSQPGKKGKAVIDGERHIYPATSDTLCKEPQDHAKVAHTRPTVLTNTHMRNVNCWKQEKCSKKRDSNDKRKKGSRTLGLHRNHDVENTYSVPKISSTLQVAGMLIQARERQPNMPQLLKTKLNSPNSAGKLRKEVCTYEEGSVAYSARCLYILLAFLFLVF